MRKMKFMLLFITQIYLFGTSLNFPCMMNFTPEWIYKPKSYSEKKIEIVKINSKICKNSKDISFFGDFELEPNLAAGEYRALNQAELEIVRHYLEKSY